MRLDYLKDRKEPVSLVLLALSAVLGVVVLVRIASFFVDSARAEKLIEDAAALSKPDPNDTERYFAESKEIAEELKKKNLFAPPPKKENPVKGVNMIISNEAFINGKWYKVGDKIGDAEVLEIKPTFVKIKWEDKEKTHRVFDFKSPEEPKKKKEKDVEKPKREKEPSQARKPEPEKVESEPVAEDDPLAWMGVKLSPALRAKILEKWNSMSDEDREKWKEQWNKMSDEQKEQAVESMEKNIDQM
ncbi:MAG: hypothetical protein ACYTEL_06155 [Planctomycetota bacterium]|jgi:hypothetical protein